MAGKNDRSRTAGPTAQELKAKIDSGQTGVKVDFPDPAASPLGTDDEAAGTPETPAQVTMALQSELNSRGGVRLQPRTRPMSPNIQIYRPQLTSVLSIANRVTGVLLAIGAMGLVAALIAAASGPYAYGLTRDAIGSWLGQLLLVGFTFAFFLHFCGGIRHLVWDSVHAFELRSIYLGGWIVVATSVALTALAWITSSFMTG